MDVMSKDEVAKITGTVPEHVITVPEASPPQFSHSSQTLKPGYEG